MVVGRVFTGETGGWGGPDIVRGTEVMVASIARKPSSVTLFRLKTATTTRSVATCHQSYRRSAWLYRYKSTVRFHRYDWSNTERRMVAPQTPTVATLARVVSAKRITDRTRSTFKLDGDLLDWDGTKHDLPGPLRDATILTPMTTRVFTSPILVGRMGNASVIQSFSRPASRSSKYLVGERPTSRRLRRHDDEWWR